MTPWNSPFAVLAKYKATKLAYESVAAPSAKPARHVRGTFGHGEGGTIPGLAPKTWNGAKFTQPHIGAYSKARASK